VNGKDAFTTKTYATTNDRDQVKVENHVTTGDVKRTVPDTRIRNTSSNKNDRSSVSVNLTPKVLVKQVNKPKSQVRKLAVCPNVCKDSKITNYDLAIMLMEDHKYSDMRDNEWRIFRVGSSPDQKSLTVKCLAGSKSVNVVYGDRAADMLRNVGVAHMVNVDD
jgi:hypothetical protein